jgi:hypothetical protein
LELAAGAPQDEPGGTREAASDARGPQHERDRVGGDSVMNAGRSTVSTRRALSLATRHARERGSRAARWQTTGGNVTLFAFDAGQDRGTSP